MVDRNQSKNKAEGVGRRMGDENNTKRIISMGESRNDVHYEKAESPNSHNTRRLVLTGLIFAMALVLTILENALPSLPLPIPGVKFGLSNIAVMYALFFLTKRQAYSIAVLKSLFVAVTRGWIAGILSLSGGILSLTAMLILMLCFKSRISYMIISISGAIAHNLGQFIAIAFIYTGMYFSGMYFWAYFPVLLIAGAVAGTITATLLRFIIPAFKRLDDHKM